MLPRATGRIEVDGNLDDPAWTQALLVDTFYETAFGDNRPPSVRTAARLMYDDHFLYVAVECDDPEPSRIRAPYVDRDQVFGEQDNFVVFLDPHNDRQTAQEFRVNPRGIQADGIYYDADGNEDFGPDFYYDAAARITARGWTAELRIPLSSLRYPRADPQSWGLLLWRNYPRDYRYLIYLEPPAPQLQLPDLPFLGDHGPARAALVAAPGGRPLRQRPAGGRGARRPATRSRKESSTARRGSTSSGRPARPPPSTSR